MKVFSLSHLRVTFLKEKDFYTEWKEASVLFKKKKKEEEKNKCRHKKNKKTHTGALSILLVDSNTGWKRERELLKVRVGFNTYRLYLNQPSPSFSLHLHSLFCSLSTFSSSSFNLWLFVSIFLWSSSSLKVHWQGQWEASQKAGAASLWPCLCWDAQCSGQAAIPVNTSVSVLCWGLYNRATWVN